jgi:isopentenyl phosphate kinase
METRKKKKVGVLMYPEMETIIDAVYPIHGFGSRSEFICKAVEFYNGFLNADINEEYMSKTTFAFLQNKLERLEARICKQLFRMCVETSIAAHISAYTSPGVNEETMTELREKCIQDVRSTIGTMRFDSIYAYQNEALITEEDEHEAEY